MRIHERIRAVRAQRNLPQKTVAERAELARSRYQALEDGANMTIASIEKVCAILGLQLVVLTNEEAADLEAARRAIGAFLPPAAPRDAAPDIAPELRERVRQMSDTVRAKTQDT